jgi:hypothetical protein
LYLEREPATSTSPSTVFRSGKERPANPFATPLRQHCQVMDIQERSSPECRETFKAHRDADRALLCHGEKHQCGGMFPQGRHEPLAYLCGEGLSAAYGVGGIGVEDVDDSDAMRSIAEFRLHDFDVHLVRLPSRCATDRRQATLNGAACFAEPFEVDV